MRKLSEEIPPEVSGAGSVTVMANKKAKINHFFTFIGQKIFGENNVLGSI